jgi:hypothetical protein
VRNQPQVGCAKLLSNKYSEVHAMQSNFGMQNIIYRIQRRVEESRKFIGDYIYYRKHNHGHAQAWRMAKNTL